MASEQVRVHVSSQRDCVEFSERAAQLDLHQLTIAVTRGSTVGLDASKLTEDVGEVNLWIPSELAASLFQSLHQDTLLAVTLSFEADLQLDAAAALGQTLRQLPTLRDLSLIGNKLRSDAAALLAQSLRHSTSLETLSVRGTEDHAAAAILDGLAHCSSVRTLEFAHQKDMDKSAAAMVRMLHASRTLQALCLSRSRMNASGAEEFKAILAGVSACTCLRSLDLTFVSVLPPEMERQLHALLAKNVYIVKIDATLQFSPYCSLRHLCNQIAERNRAFWAARAALHAVSMPQGHGFANLGDITLRNKVLSCLIPEQLLLKLATPQASSYIAVAESAMTSGAEPRGGLTQKQELAEHVDNYEGEHLEPAAVIDPDEAAATAEGQRITFIEHRLANADSSAKTVPGVPVAPGNAVVLLTFSRSSPELDAALRRSSHAEVARLQGVDVQPEWSRGCKILVPGVGPQHLEPPFVDTMLSDPRHAVVYADDVGDLLQELQDAGLPYSIRKVKARDNLPSMPGRLSLAAMSSSSRRADAVSIGASDAEEEQLEVQVRHTFIHIKAAATDSRSVFSAGF